jgi:fatty-acyl-CoA synthase
MMEMPLLVTTILRHAAAWHGDTEVVSVAPDGVLHRTTYAEIAGRAARLANALAALGIVPGDRVATLAWNGFRHLELYYGVSGSGAVCHTVNPRLFEAQIDYILGHAEDAALFLDPSFLPLAERLAPRLRDMRAVVVLGDAEAMPRSAALPKLLCYETLLAESAEDYDWPDLDERTASSLCYTSGTTAEPKGVLYSHRSTVLHAMAVALPDVLGLAATDVVCPIVPMFHVNGWGLPYAVPMVGGTLVLPGAKLDGASLHALFEREGVTFSAGVPTVWLGLLDWMDAHDVGFSTLRRVTIGGSAVPPVMIRRFNERGVAVRHAWGMTETSPLGLASAPKAKHRTEDAEARLEREARQGRPVFGVDFRIEDAGGRPVPRDGRSFGKMLVRGPWVASGYFRADSPAHEVPGWFNTGDVVTMDADGFVQIVDRTKDVVKSGGEWISSIALENIAQAHPAVLEAAVVARPDARWGERPVLVVALKPGATLTPDEVRAHFEGRVARWSIPEDLLIVPELPHTATGKLLKTAVRRIVAERLAEGGPAA